MVTPEQLPRALHHDPVVPLRARLPGTRLTDGHEADLVRALRSPARWSLERPQPVWLLLVATWTDAQLAPLRAACRRHGGVLVVAEPGAASLAESVDAVALEHGALDPELLLRARCRGADVVVLGPNSAGWWQGLQAGPDNWEPLLQRWRAAGRRTGWPWREKRS